MNGWIIFGAVLLFLVFLFTRHLRVTVIWDRAAEVYVRYLFFTLYRYPAPPKKPKRTKKAKKQKKTVKKASPADNKQKREKTDIKPEDKGAGKEKPAEKQEDSPGGNETKKNTEKKKAKKGAGLDIELIKRYIESASPPIKRLFKKIKLRDIYLDYVVGSDDAAKTALKYGGVCAAVYSLSKFLSTYFDTKIGEINIEADFSAEKDDIFLYAQIRLRLSTLIACGIWLAVRVYKVYSGSRKPEPAA